MDVMIVFWSLLSSEIIEGFRSLGVDIDLALVEETWPQFDADESGDLCFDEFMDLFADRVKFKADSEGEDQRHLEMRAKCILKTDEWVQAVTKYKSSNIVAELFSPDAVLLGTVSRTIRSRTEGGTLGIKEYCAPLFVSINHVVDNIHVCFLCRYFDYFAKLPEIEVVTRLDTIAQITDDVFVNNAMVYWAWQGDGAPTVAAPLCARMTFIFRANQSIDDVELFQLHSSALPAAKID